LNYHRCLIEKKIKNIEMETRMDVIRTCCINYNENEINNAINRLEKIEGIIDIRIEPCRNHMKRHNSIIVTCESDQKGIELFDNIKKAIWGQKMSGYNPNKKGSPFSEEK